MWKPWRVWLFYWIPVFETVQETHYPIHILITALLDRCFWHFKPIHLPHHKTLTKRATPSISKYKVEFIDKTSATNGKACPLRSNCIAEQTPHRKIWWWEHEVFIQSYRESMQTESAKAIIKRRGSIVEHPFGTIKRSLGWDH